MYSKSGKLSHTISVPGPEISGLAIRFEKKNEFDFLRLDLLIIHELLLLSNAVMGKYT